MNNFLTAAALTLTILTPASAMLAEAKSPADTGMDGRSGSSTKVSNKSKPRTKSGATEQQKQEIRERIKKMCNEAMALEQKVGGDAAVQLAQEIFNLTEQHFGKDSPEMVWPEFTMGHVLTHSRDAKNSVPHFERAYSLATKYPDNPCMRARYIETWLFKAELRSGQTKQATALIAGTLAELEKTNNVEKLQDYALQYMKNGDCKEADELMVRAVLCCERKDKRLLLPALQQQIMVLLRCRHFKEAIPVLERKRDLLRAKGDQVGVANAVRELGQLSDLSERFEQSSRYYKEALALFRTQKRDKDEIAKLLMDYSRVRRNLGQSAEADALKKESEDLRFGMK